MCEVLDKVERRGLEKGRKEGRRRGRVEGRMEGLRKGRMEGRDESILAVYDIISIDELVKRFHVTPEYIKNLLKRRNKR